MNEQDKLLRILECFDIDGNAVEVKPLGSGLINKTYTAYYRMNNGEDRKFLLQNINTNVFRNPVELMENVVNVTSFLKKKIAEENGDTSRETLSIYTTKDGKNFYLDEDSKSWRVYNFIDNAFSYDAIESPELFREAGAAFGKFQTQLADFPMDRLFETIPSFHNTANRYKNFEIALEKNSSGRAGSVPDEIAFIKERKDKTSYLVDLLEKGELPLRVTHNDTKLNNVMFDKITNRPVCIVDLDTVMPGLSLYDFGDAIRYGANTTIEDDTDLDKVKLDLGLYEQYINGYLSTAGESLTDKEIENLPMSVWMITFENAIRFITDYFDGDVYFGIKYPEHNIDRCRNQLALVKDIESKFDDMMKITLDAYAKVKEN